MRVADALAEARTAGVERLDAQLMLGRALARPRVWLLAHDEFELDEAQAGAWREMLRRRAGGEPLAYLFGRCEFYGIELDVDPHVLVPRSDTESLVDWALERLGAAECGAAPRVVDLGTGSGAIAIAIRSACPPASVTAVDASAAALAVARANAKRLGLEIEFVEGDWWQPLAGRRFDLVVANPPYVPAGDPHLAALRHEPIAALASGADGLLDLRRIVAFAPAHVEAGGWLLLEHGNEQAPDVRDLLACAGFGEISTRCDIAGRPRVSGGRAPALGPVAATVRQ